MVGEQPGGLPEWAPSPRCRSWRRSISTPSTRPRGRPSGPRSSCCEMPVCRVAVVPSAMCVHVRSRLLTLPAGLPTCPRRLPYMSNLREVDLSSNRIVEMPYDIGELRKLRILNLSYNFLASLPPSIADLVILRTLNVSHNVLEGIPEQLGELKRVEEVDVHDNSITALPPALGKCTNLRYLNVAENLLEDLPPELGGLEALEELNVSFNMLSELHAQLGGCIQLRKLDVRANDISEVPETIFLDTSLDRIFTHDCPVHAVLKQQRAYDIFQERKLRRIKARGWPPEIHPNRLKGWGDN